MVSTRLKLFTALFATLLLAMSFTVLFEPAKADTVLPYTSFGADYTIYFADSAISIWESPTNFINPLLNYLDNGFPCVTLAFTFEGNSEHGSTFSYSKMDDLLDLLESYGCDQVIFALYPPYEHAVDVKPIGNATWQTWLENVVTYYKDDSRVVGLQPYGEPATEFIATGLTTLQAIQWMANECITLHAIDSDLIIFYPYWGECYTNYTTMFTDIASTSIQDYSYIWMDIVHPYFFENSWDMGLTPTQKAAYYETTFITPAKTYFNPARLCCRETFYWPSATPALQHEWIVAIVNQFVDNTVSFCFAWSIPHLAWYTYYQEALADSDYGSELPTPTYPPTPPPTATPAPTATPTPPPYPYPTPTATATVPEGISGITSSSVINLAYDEGESLRIQSSKPVYTMLFTVESGSWYGEATITVTESNGLLAFQPTTSGTLTVVPSSISIRVTVNDAAYAGAFTFTSGKTYYIRWNRGSFAPVVVITNELLYLRSETQTTNGQVGFLLSPDGGHSNATAFWWDSGSSTVYFGWTAYHVSSDGSTAQLATDISSPQMSFASNGEGYNTSSLSIPQTNLVLGKDAIKVLLFIKIGMGSWQTAASFVTPLLMEKQIESGTWQLTLYCKRYYDGTNTYATAYWGDVDSSNSTITGVEFSDVLPQEIALAYAQSGDFFGMIMYPYMIVAGDWIYGLGFLFGAGVYYFRYKKFEPVLIIILLFGELLGFMIPALAWRLFYFLLLFVFAVVLFRVMH